MMERKENTYAQQIWPKTDKIYYKVGRRYKKDKSGRQERKKNKNNKEALPTMNLL